MGERERISPGAVKIGERDRISPGSRKMSEREKKFSLEP